MTINKEQAVSDAMIAAGEEVYAKWAVGKNGDTAIFKAIYLAMKAASHPLEQQQAVSGDVVERLSQQIANAMQRARAECGGDRVSFAYAEAAMRSELRAALTASGMGTWQPIETAPKDVDRLLFYCPVVRKNLRTLREEPVGWVLGGSFDDGELFVDNSHGGGVPWKLTHWMPLPEPPRTALQEDTHD